MEQNIEEILSLVSETVESVKGVGKLANYIPALSEIKSNQFGMSVSTMDGSDFIIGDAKERFSIQSISKVFCLSMGIHYAGEALFNRVGVEPSGTAFNSLSQLEFENGIPRNPFINAGALVITDVLLEHINSPNQYFLDFVRGLSNNTDIHYDKQVYLSELSHNNRNAALCHYLKSFNNIHNDIAKILDFYCYQCSLSMSCMDLSRAFRFLAQDGSHPFDKTRQVVSKQQARRINSLMMTCGTYDEAGEFAFRVGLPCKSGVGGGIIAIIPNKMSICVWGPKLGPKGNSLAGMEALETFVRQTGYSVF